MSELLDNQKKEMRELEEARIRLDSEIKTYDILLKEEFERLEQARKKRKLSVSRTTISDVWQLHSFCFANLLTL